MYHIAICDDEPQIRAELRQMLSHHEQAAEFIISEFSTGEVLCERLRAGQHYLLLLLDIELATLNGVGVGRVLREELRDNAAQILYISGKEQYAMELFDLRPLNFLVKPAKEEKLLACVSDALALAPEQGRVFSFLCGKETHRLPLQEIRYFESCNKKLLIHAAGGDFECYMRLGEVADTLPKPEFFQIHQSYLVNYRYVAHIRYDRLTLTDGRELSISQTYRKQVRELLFSQFPKGEEQT